VKVKRPGLTVRARRGYFAPDAVDASAKPPTADLDPEVRRALDSPRDVADLPVRATALVFDRVSTDAARVVIAADVDVKSFLFEPEEGGRSRGSVELAVAATRLDTGEVFHFEQTTAMNLKAETRDRLGVTWYSVSREFSLPSGAYQARVVIRDRTSGRIGSVTHAFDVPPLTGFRVSSPLLTDVLQTDPTGQAAPKAGAPGAADVPQWLDALLSIHRLWGRRRGGDREAAGQRQLGSPARRRQPRSRGAGDRIGAGQRRQPRAHLRHLARGPASGRLRARLAVRDEIGVKLAELREPFTVERAVGIR
jgi:hypothetical protein